MRRRSSVSRCRSSSRRMRIEARCQGGERLAEPSGGQQALVEVATVKDDDVHVARKAAVLEAVVEKMDAGREAGGMLALGNESGCVAIGPKDRKGRRERWLAGNQDRLVAVARGGAFRVDSLDTLSVRPYPRESTSTWWPCSVSSCARRMTTGVFPAPPTGMPTLMTGQERRFG